jgi:RNA exonuclease 1
MVPGTMPPMVPGRMPPMVPGTMPPMMPLTMPPIVPGAATSNGLDCPKENSRVSLTENTPYTRSPSHRQRKNRRRQNTSPETKMKIWSKQSGVPRNCVGSVMTEKCFWCLLQPHLLTQEQMYHFGFPMESYEDGTILFKINNTPFARTRPSFNVNACDSSPKECMMSLPSVQRRCVRCSKPFFVTAKGYLTQERCIYHWGKLRSTPGQGYKTLYTCCQGKPDAPGCTDCELHVWNGYEAGVNRNCEGFVKTHPAEYPAEDGFHGVYAVDCEMSYTVAGLELTKVTVVAVDGAVAYQTLVNPKNPIVDCNTRFSGITQRDLKVGPTKSLPQVQDDLRVFIRAETLLIGHGLENDLRALKMIHSNVVDTSISFPHHKGPPFRYSLKQLMATYLNRDIQCGTNGHDSYEDASACIQLMVFKVQVEEARLV